MSLRKIPHTEQGGSQSTSICSSNSSSVSQILPQAPQGSISWFTGTRSLTITLLSICLYSESIVCGRLRLGSNVSALNLSSATCLDSRSIFATSSNSGISSSLPVLEFVSGFDIGPGRLDCNITS